jgi:arginase
MRLIDGAEAILGDLPQTSTVTVAVPLEAGDDLGSGVARCSSLQVTYERAREALIAIDDWALTVGGDCSAELAPIAHAVERASGDVAVLWFDAHADLNNHMTSRTGAFTGMVLRAVTGDGCAELVPTTVLPSSHIVLAGTRSFDAHEATFIAQEKIRTLTVDDLNQVGTIIEAVEATGAGAVYIHVDLDVLDPSEIDGINDPVPFGVSAEVLIGAITAVRQKYRIVGAGVTSFAPSSRANASDDLPTILRIIGALTREIHPA